ncbi:unnamed protein product [Penicillium olsonii]|nr:unnamed protein product [Penicillium olsonii]CAG7931660.1 unnamed protein product [Penicillium olsonii]
MAVVKTPKPTFPAEAAKQEYAASLDAEDALREFRNQFIIPSTANLATKKLAKPGLSDDSSIYFAGNSLGLQPKAVAKYMEAQLDTWSSVGVGGHFTDLEDSPMPQWQLMSEKAATSMSRLVGAQPEEVAAMGTLTMNLHLLLASFYRPTETRSKILMDWKAFPSDHYAIESQIAWHDLDAKKNMVLIGPDEGQHEISTEKILSIIDQHAEDAALILLPGIQYYTGQLFDIPTITKYAHSKGLIVGWDLAHAFANAELKLHDWDVDFAVWCTYKYGNAGPGSMGALFVHEKHGQVDYSDGPDAPKFRHRLTGWYGGDRSVRFKMDNKYKPIPGAGGFQISTSSVMDLTSLCAAMSVFDQTSIQALRQKSIKLTAYLEFLLLKDTDEETRLYDIITPSDPDARGAQLSVLLKPGLLHKVAERLQNASIICDKREPGVVRVAPVPLYNTYSDVFKFVKEFKGALASS